MPNTRHSSVGNFLSLEFPSLSNNTNVACAAITVLAKQMLPHPTKDDISNINTAVSEVINNAIVHGYPDGIGMISIRARLLNRNILEIKVSDKGNGIENVEEARTGLGFRIMENFMTTLDVRSTPGKGTIVKMEYHISQSKEKGDLA